MKKQILLPAALLLGLATMFSSCKKDNDDAVNPSTEACTLDHKTTSADSTQLTFDSENRVIKEQRFNNLGNSQEYTLYTYSTSKITEKNYNDAGDLVSQVDYHLNSNNNVSYSVHTADGQNFDEADTVKYSYDTNEHNTRRVTKHTALSTLPFVPPVITYDTIWYTYTGENLTKKEEKVAGATSPETTIYSYGSDDAKSEFLAAEQTSPVKNLYGDASEKLPISMTEGSTTTSYIYTFNSEGYVTRKREVISSVTQQDIRYYYNCK